MSLPSPLMETEALRGGGLVKLPGKKRSGGGIAFCIIKSADVPGIASSSSHSFLPPPPQCNMRVRQRKGTKKRSLLAVNVA